MIRYLLPEEKRETEKLYRAAFPEDKDEFVRYYYSYVTKENRILVLEEEGQICSMLHLNPYRLSVNGTALDAYYYVAVATRSDCRHRGMMKQLLRYSLQDIHGEGHPFTYLMPADRAIYEPFDFRIIYEQKQIELSENPKTANQQMAKLFDVYTLRDSRYVEKMLEETRICEGDPPFDIIPYIMARVTHVEKMLELLRSREPLRILLRVNDPIIRENTGMFLWEISDAGSSCKKMSEEFYGSSGAIDLTIAELTEFVFGRKTIQGLENVEVLSRICINEAV